VLRSPLDHRLVPGEADAAGFIDDVVAIFKRSGLLEQTTEVGRSLRESGPFASADGRPGILPTDRAIGYGNGLVCAHLIRSPIPAYGSVRVGRAR